MNPSKPKPIEKTILLGLNPEQKLKTTQTLYFVLAFCMLVTGLANLLGTNFQPLRMIMGGLMILAGIGNLIVGIQTFSEKYKLAPRVSLQEELFEFKSGLFAKTIRIPWMDIRSLELSSYSIIVELNESKKQLKYHTQSSISKEIKQAIRDFANAKEIPVLGQ